jgi:hypothetical protein
VEIHWSKKDFSLYSKSRVTAHFDGEIPAIHVPITDTAPKTLPSPDTKAWELHVDANKIHVASATGLKMLQKSVPLLSGWNGRHSLSKPN